MPFSRVAVIGSRSISLTMDVENILNNLLANNGPFTLVTGGAEGPDTVASAWANRHNLQTSVHDVDLDSGASAGTKRNAALIAEAEVLLAFWDGVSPNTMDAIKKAKAQKKPLRVYLC